MIPDLYIMPPDPYIELGKLLGEILQGRNDIVKNEWVILTLEFGYKRGDKECEIGMMCLKSIENHQKND